MRRPLEPVLYLPLAYTDRLAGLGIAPSVGSCGDSHDNTLAEAVNAAYKIELINRGKPWRCIDDVELATAEWVDWYNLERLHEALGYQIPAEYETALTGASHPAIQPPPPSQPTRNKTWGSSGKIVRKGFPKLAGDFTIRYRPSIREGVFVARTPAFTHQGLGTMPRPRGHGRNYHKKKNEIVDLAAKLFLERGYAATNLDDLAVAARLGKGALYYYINSKEDLLVEIQSRVVLPAQMIANEISELDLDPVLRLRILSEAILTLMFQRLPHIWAREHDSRHLTGKNLEQSHRERRLFEDSVCCIMDEGISSGIFRPMEPRLAMLQFLNLHVHTYRWVNPERDWTPCYLSQEYCRTLFGGMWSEESKYDSAGLEARLAAFLEGETPAFVRNVLGLTHLRAADRNS